MQGAKETASNVAASAKSGLEKAKATTQEKVEKMTTRDPVEKEMARERKEERVTQAELDKQEARGHNAAARHTGTHDYTATETGGAPDYLTGDPGYTTGVQPTRRQTGGVVGSQNRPGEYTGTGQVPIRDTQTGVGHPDHAA
ncbi:11 kDa late embryogenesis abundant protein-like [Rhododendron vialii]|uniref:11 kDa late embryogenesis abundant protein-like n=1 Tax=Rhododendron vialii TaxID=182163 RepID=UPI00265DDC1E|nr:11 kDa late embryogenesis abundant protein-like [Rhododendron vialii]